MDNVEDWSLCCPKAKGNYLVKCIANGFQPQKVRVFEDASSGELLVDDADVGVIGLKEYHFELSRISWKKIK